MGHRFRGRIQPHVKLSSAFKGGRGCRTLWRPSITQSGGDGGLGGGGWRGSRNPHNFPRFFISFPAPLYFFDAQNGFGIKGIRKILQFSFRQKVTSNLADWKREREWRKQSFFLSPVFLGSFSVSLGQKIENEMQPFAHNVKQSKCRGGERVGEKILLKPVVFLIFYVHKKIQNNLSVLQHL